MSADVRRPPGPRGKPVVGVLPDFRKDPLGTLMSAHREFGDIVFFKGILKAYFFVDPASVEHLLDSNYWNWPHPGPFDKMFGSAATGVITVEGEEWGRQRRMLEPAFTDERLKAYAPIVTQATGEALDRWGAHANGLELSAEMDALSQTIVGRVVFGADWDAHAARLGEGITWFAEYLDRKIGTPIGMVPQPVPVPTHVRHKREGRRYDEVAVPLIQERRGADGTDLACRYMNLRDEGGRAMDDHEGREQVTSTFVAGHVPIRTTLSWTWYLLSKHPEQAAKLRAELAEVLGGRTPTVDDLPALRYTTMVIKEVLRLYPPLSLLARTAVADDEVGGYEIPKGSLAVMCPYVSHRHEVTWPDPEAFDPERFTEERSAGRPPGAWFPFAAGPRECLGMDFAMIALPLIVAMTAQRYRLQVAPEEPKSLPLLALEMRQPVPLTVEPV